MWKYYFKHYDLTCLDLMLSLFNCCGCPGIGVSMKTYYSTKVNNVYTYLHSNIAIGNDLDPV